MISNILIVLSIMAGFVAIVYRDTTAYQQLGEKHLENVVSLAEIDISKHIENSMTRPVMVSKTMANDVFLKGWLHHELENKDDEAYLEQLYTYLKAYQRKYDYTSVFCISAQTGNYYYQDGLNKTLSMQDEHDIWYYNFLSSGREYDLEVDTNEVHHNIITVFVNFRVEDENRSLLGVIGVGLQVASIEEAIRVYERDYDLSVFIVNTGGAKNSFDGNTDTFVKEEDLHERIGIQEKLALAPSIEPVMQWFTSGDKRKCLVTRYDDTLGWYLVLEKDTSSISSTFQNRIKANILFMLISMVVCTAVTTVIILNYNQRMVEMENTDDLTGLPNRKLFTKQCQAFIHRNRERNKTIFMLDVDNFKNINDTKGHIFGNEVLAAVGERLKKAVKGYGIAARWGGDEFLGVLKADTLEAEQILGRFMETLKNEEKHGDCSITVSVGLARMDGRYTTEQVIDQADKALYCSKEVGRDRVTVWEEGKGLLV